MLDISRSALTGSIRRLGRSLRTSLNARRDFPELSVAALETKGVPDTFQG